ncbi:hypothetical protein J3D45_000835 [Microbacterium foliorum]|nr:hypothetical protein [Microbacterium foliorum]
MSRPQSWELERTDEPSLLTLISERRGELTGDVDPVTEQLGRYDRFRLEHTHRRSPT